MMAPTGETTDSVTDPVTSAVCAALVAPPYVLAVSGGVDSMVLLDAAARTVGAGGTALTVATFDHGTGAAASAAVQLVVNHAATLGLPCVVGASRPTRHKEAEWRRERWTFLKDVGIQAGGTIVT